VSRLGSEIFRTDDRPLVMIARNVCSRSNETSVHHQVKSPLTITETEVDEAVSRLDAALGAAARS